MDRCEECGFEYDLSRDVDEPIRAGAAEVADLLRTGVRLRSRRQPSVWSPLEYGCHVRDMLLVQRERVLAARRSEATVECTPMGRDERVDHDGYAEQDPADVARQLTDAAALFTGVLARFEPADWDRTVGYVFPEPARRTLRWVAVHTLHEVRHHLLDIRRQVTR